VVTKSGHNLHTGGHAYDHFWAVSAETFLCL
jgi:hypothetical protein